MIILKRYKPTNADRFIGIIFSFISLFGLFIGYIGKADLIAFGMLSFSCFVIFVLSVLPFTGLGWIDSIGNIHFFPNKREYILQERE